MWAECGRTACELDNLDCENKAGKPRYVLFYGKDYKAFPYLRKFGEIGVVKQGDKIKSKLVNRGEACVYLGHAENHSADVARFMKLSTKRVIRSRDVKWLKKTFQDYQESEGIYQSDDDGDSDLDHSSDSEDEVEENEPADVDTRVTTQQFRELVNALPDNRAGREESTSHLTPRVTRSGL